MKKTLALVFLMVLALACAAPPTNKDLSAGTNRAANVAPEKPAGMAMTEADAIAKEKAIWETIKTKDYEAFANMLAEEQVEVIDIGVNDKAASIAGVKQFEPSEVAFSDWKYLPIDKDAVVVSYTANYKGRFEGKEVPAQTVRASSAWVNRAGKWVAIFHQECPVKPPMAQPAASKTPAKPVASPSVAPTTATPGTDPIANEKMVWDLFKTKNYDAFANLLATDFLEIEPDGVYDKAGSVKGVSMMDASKFVLSDFKTVSIDADAALVTYVATEPKMAPKGERHSTIWVNRDGKWQGLLHHGGTPVMTKPATPKASASPRVSASPSATVK
jgi:hypothetical protein